MIRAMVLVLSLCIAVLFVGHSFAADRGPAETVLEGCKKELETYCKSVTPGQGHLLACVYAHEDKLSARCEYSLYEASVQLERAVNALAYVASECRDDLRTYCSSTQPGEGRLLICLDKQRGKISQRCTQALKDTGMKK